MFILGFLFYVSFECDCSKVLSPRSFFFDSPCDQPGRSKLVEHLKISSRDLAAKNRPKLFIFSSIIFGWPGGCENCSERE